MAFIVVKGVVADAVQDINTGEKTGHESWADVVALFSLVVTAIFCSTPESSFLTDNR
ncbi:MAG: hypothetical protein KAS94_02870 [Desulfobulbaceae bacterium]|nr:hypothetical protein [Desulfobulbaceae bacterium]